MREGCLLVHRTGCTKIPRQQKHKQLIVAGKMELRERAVADGKEVGGFLPILKN